MANEMREVSAPVRGGGPVHCCGGHRERCIFGRPHVWSVWYENAKLQRTLDTFHCYDCGGVCTAEEDEAMTTKPATMTEYEVLWSDGDLFKNRWDETVFTIGAATQIANRIGGSLRLVGYEG